MGLCASYAGKHRALGSVRKRTGYTITDHLLELSGVCPACQAGRGTVESAWGYFARDFNLEQIPVEVGGQEPSARELAHLIEEAQLDILIATLVVLFYKELLAISFDETFATVENVPVDAIYIVLLCLIALTVVMMMRVVGLIMVIAMLTMPAAIAGAFVKDMKQMMVGSIMLAMLFIVVGLWLSYAWNLTSGPSAILVSGLSYLISLGVKPLWQRYRPVRSG